MILFGFFLFSLALLMGVCVLAGFSRGVSLWGLLSLKALSLSPLWCVVALCMPTSTCCRKLFELLLFDHVVSFVVSALSSLVCDVFFAL